MNPTDVVQKSASRKSRRRSLDFSRATGNPQVIPQLRLLLAGVTVLPGASSGASWISNFVLVSAEWFLEGTRGKPYQCWVFW